MHVGSRGHSLLGIDHCGLHRVDGDILRGNLRIPRHLLNIIDVDVVDPVIEVPDIQRETVLVDQVDVVHLLVYVLVPTWLLCHHLSLNSVGSPVRLGRPRCIALSETIFIHVRRGLNPLYNTGSGYIYIAFLPGPIFKITHVFK